MISACCSDYRPTTNNMISLYWFDSSQHLWVADTWESSTSTHRWKSFLLGFLITIIIIIITISTITITIIIIIIISLIYFSSASLQRSRSCLESLLVYWGTCLFFRWIIIIIITSLTSPLSPFLSSKASSLCSISLWSQGGWPGEPAPRHWALLQGDLQQ